MLPESNRAGQDHEIRVYHDRSSAGYQLGLEEGMIADCSKCRREYQCYQLDKEKVMQSGKCMWYQEETGVLSDRNWV